MYAITTKLLSRNNPKTLLKPQGIVIHETATLDATADDEYNYFNNNFIGASAHAFIDSENIIQTIDWNCVSWHAGQTANRKFIGLEMCHTNDTYRFNEIWSRTVYLCAWLFNTKLMIKTVSNDNLMSHKEVSDKYKETDHQDPISYFAQYQKTFDMFRKDVQAMIDKMNAPPPLPHTGIPQWKKDGAQWLVDNGYTKELHNPLEIIDIGTFGAMLKNKIKGP